MPGSTHRIRTLIARKRTTYPQSKWIAPVLFSIFHIRRCFFILIPISVLNFFYYTPKWGAMASNLKPPERWFFHPSGGFAMCPAVCVFLIRVGPAQAVCLMSQDFAVSTILSISIFPTPVPNCAVMQSAAVVVSSRVNVLDVAPFPSRPGFPYWPILPK